MKNSSLKSERRCYSTIKEKADADLKQCSESSSNSKELYKCYQKAAEKNSQRVQACMYSHVI
ncbi:MAG: hypothetical protein R6X10_16275 [Desulfobacterales bacterium]